MPFEPDDTLLARLNAEAENHGIPCERALALAVELGIPPAELGQILDRLKIKVRRCQLGCF